jgi:site-specific recombinase XerD
VETVQTSEESRAKRNFINAIRSIATKRAYERGLNRFMKFLGIEKYNYDKLLEYDSKAIESHIIDYIIFIKDSGLSYTRASIDSAAIRKFYKMNDVFLNWEKINEYRPDNESVLEDTPYTREQIRKLLGIAGIREQCMILLMSSAGLRLGALPILRIKDLVPVDKYNLYLIPVYKRSKKSKYITFCTPECRTRIDEYLEYRKRMGEHLTFEAPLFRKEFSVKYEKARPIADSTIQFHIASLLNKSGVRPKKHLVEGQKFANRTNLQQCHGLRKYFDTTVTKSGMDIYISEKLMGHSLGLKERYTKLSDSDLLEGNDKMRGYICAINDLTINEEFRLKTKVDELTQKKNEIELMEGKHREELKSMREEMETKFQQILTKIDIAKVK